MHRPKPHFRAQMCFTFEEHGPGRRHRFLFQEDQCRAVPISMEGVAGLNTVGMWSDQPGKFYEGDKVMVDCAIGSLDAFRNVVQPGVKFRLWDGGFFADGVVIQIFEEAWGAEKPNHQEVKCAQCRGDFRLTLPESAEDSLRVLRTHRNGSLVEAIRLLRESTGCGLRDAKAIMMHVPKDEGHCHRCSAPIPSHGTVECQECKSMNIQLIG